MPWQAIHHPSAHPSRSRSHLLFYSLSTVTGHIFMKPTHDDHLMSRPSHCAHCQHTVCHFIAINMASRVKMLAGRTFMEHHNQVAGIVYRSRSQEQHLRSLEHKCTHTYIQYQINHNEICRVCRQGTKGTTLACSLRTTGHSCLSKPRLHAFFALQSALSICFCCKCLYIHINVLELEQHLHYNLNVHLELQLRLIR